MTSRQSSLLPTQDLLRMLEELAVYHRAVVKCDVAETLVEELADDSRRRHEASIARVLLDQAKQNLVDAERPIVTAATTGVLERLLAEVLQSRELGGAHLASRCCEPDSLDPNP